MLTKYANKFGNSYVHDAPQASETTIFLTDLCHRFIFVLCIRKDAVFDDSPSDR